MVSLVRSGIPLSKTLPVRARQFATASSLWKQDFPSPVEIFSVEDVDVPLRPFIASQKRVFQQLPADEYDVKKRQLDLLMQHISQSQREGFLKTFTEYYLGEEGVETLEPYLKQLPEKKRTQFDQVQPFRFRAVSRFHAQMHDGKMMLDRLPAHNFSQERAVLEDPDQFDIRQLPRTFTELPEKHASDSLFTKLIQGVASKVYKTVQQSLNIVVHHTRVETYSEFVTSNSPEGIHQDGCDYIVSALVIERQHIRGAVSQIFGDDKKTCLLQTRLQPGFAILQPDAGTRLWHHVTPMYVASQAENKGFRSSIGLDIDIVNEER